MKREMTILYEVHNNLYVNLTNECPCACVFCIRMTKDAMDHSGSLWLEHDPTIDEVKLEFQKFDMTKYKEVVFCGYGEPTERLYDMLELAAYIKAKYQKPIRVNTNGLSDLLYQEDTAPLFKDLVDTVSISLNAPNAKRYCELTQSEFGIESFDAVLKFAENVKNYVKEVVLTTVETMLTKKEEKECEEICKRIGVSYRIRAWEE